MIRRTTTTVTFLGSLLALPGLALAHGGHGNPAHTHSLLHWVTEPVHVLALLPLAVGLGAWILLRRRGGTAPNR